MKLLLLLIKFILTTRVGRVGDLTSAIVAESNKGKIRTMNIYSETLIVNQIDCWLIIVANDFNFVHILFFLF